MERKKKDKANQERLATRSNVSGAELKQAEKPAAVEEDFDDEDEEEDYD